MRLAERDVELSVLSDTLDRSTAGHGGFIVVSGPRGGGKSALVQAAEETGRARGMRTLVVRGSWLAGAARVDLVWAARDLLRQATGRQRAPDPRGLAAELVESADSTPLLIAIDDAHLADTRSRALVLELLPYVADSPIAVVLVDHRCENIFHWLRHDLLGRAEGRHLTVGPLSAAGTREVVHDRLGQEPDERMLDEVFQVTGGNPALVQAVLNDVTAVPGGGRRTPAFGFAFAQAVLSLVHSCEGSLLPEVARAIAALGESSCPDLLMRLVDVDRRILGQLLSELGATGVLTEGGVLPARVRAVVLGSLAPDALHRLRLRVADVLHDDGAPADRVAHHLLATGAAPQPWSIGVLREAAEIAVARNQHAHAVSLLKFAAGQCADHGTKVETQARLLDVMWWMDPAVVSRQLTSLLPEVRQGYLPGPWMARLARRLTWQGQVDDAHEVLGLTAAIPSPDNETLMELATSDFWLRHVFPGAPGARLGNELGPEITAGTAPWLPNASELPALLADGRHEAVAARAGEILQQLQPNLVDLEPLHVAIFSLLAVERFDPAQTWFARLAGPADAARPAQFRAALTAATATFSWWRGDLGAAVADATQALALLDGERWCVLAGLPRGVLLLAMTEQGRHREVEEELARPVLGTFARSPYGLVYLRARGRHHLATGSLQAALSDFRSCGEILGSWGLELPGLLPWRIDVAEALLGLGQHEEAEHWLAEQLRLTPSERSRTRGIALRLGATTMPLARRGTVLRESATVLERCGDTLELARTLGTLAHTYQLTGNLKYGRATMRRAEKMARNSDGHWALAQLSAHSVGPAVQAPPREQHVAGGSLSLAEVKVARLAAQGYTNREIAHTLYVTVSTVEQHLTRIYRKLSIRRRSELSHLVGSR